MQSYTFHVNGMHCKSCVALTEHELGEVLGVSSVKASLSKLNVEVEGEFGERTPEQIAHDLSEVLKPYGYSLSLEKQGKTVAWSDFNRAIPIAALFVALFIVLQKLGIVNLVSTSDVSYGTAFLIGLIASVSTCMAVVGGLVLSMSASFAKEGDKVRPQILFHAGRLLSFFFLGGAIGALGAVFQLGVTGTAMLGLLVGIVMLALGINLLDVFHGAKKFQFTLPSSIGVRVHALKNLNHTLTPFLVGIATFVLPCGFTQSMQLYALTTGSFVTGALLMTSFALGTLPVLALLSFSSFSIRDSAHAGVFFKTAGLIVLFFAFFTILSALTTIGLIPPLFNL